MQRPPFLYSSDSCVSALCPLKGKHSTFSQGFSPQRFHGLTASKHPNHLVKRPSTEDPARHPKFLSPQICTTACQLMWFTQDFSNSGVWPRWRLGRSILIRPWFFTMRKNKAKQLTDPRVRRCFHRGRRSVLFCAKRPVSTKGNNSNRSEDFGKNLPVTKVQRQQFPGRGNAPDPWWVSTHAETKKIPTMNTNRRGFCEYALGKKKLSIDKAIFGLYFRCDLATAVSGLYFRCDLATAVSGLRTSAVTAHQLLPVSGSRRTTITSRDDNLRADKWTFSEHLSLYLVMARTSRLSQNAKGHLGPESAQNETRTSSQTGNFTSDRQTFHKAYSSSGFLEPPL